MKKNAIDRNGKVTTYSPALESFVRCVLGLSNVERIIGINEFFFVIINAIGVVGGGREGVGGGGGVRVTVGGGDSDGMVAVGITVSHCCCCCNNSNNKIKIKMKAMPSATHTEMAGTGTSTSTKSNKQTNQNYKSTDQYSNTKAPYTGPSISVQFQR